jgi:hypothetical protein
MNKEFVTYQIALDMKSIGFGEPCLAYYNKKELFSFTQICNEPLKGHYIKMSNRLCAPLYQQAFRWFRNKHGLFVAPNVISYESSPYLWFFEINSIILPLGTDLGETDDYKTYEEAELACLKKLIEIVKEK